MSLVAPGKLGTSYTHVGSVMTLVCKLGTSYTHVGSVMILGDGRDGDGL